MGTPGKVILKANNNNNNNNNGQTVHIYNHFDSYPNYLGVKIIGYLCTLLKTYGETPAEALPKIRQRIAQCQWISDSSPKKSDIENLKTVLSSLYPNDESIDFRKLFYYANIVEMMKAGYFHVTRENNFYTLEPFKGVRFCSYEYMYILDFDLEVFEVLDIEKRIKVVYPFSMLTEDNARMLMDSVGCTEQLCLDDL